MKKELDEKRVQDKLAAHLGLAAADDHGKTTIGEDCYSPEQLADIAANVCSAEQKEKALAHFSECQACYDNWVAACFSLAAMDRGYSKRGFVLTFRNLSYIGSALAIAASVVLFLNISGDKDLRQIGPEVQMQMQKETESLPAPASSDMASDKEPSPGVEKKMAASKQVRSATDAVRFETSNARVAEESFSDEAVQEGSESFGGDEIQMMSVKTKAMEAVPAPDMLFSDWLLSVEQSCTEGNGELSHWSELQEKGQALLETTRGSGTRLLTGEQRVLLFDITEELSQLDRADQIEMSCDRIARLVAQAKEKE